MSTVYVIPLGDDPEQHQAAAAKAKADTISVGLPPDAPAGQKIPGAFTRTDPPPPVDRVQLRQAAASATTIAQLRDVLVQLLA